MSARHFFLIDPIEKLNIKKDSSLLMALSAQELAGQSYLIFKDDFCVATAGESLTQKAYSFSGQIGSDFYLNHFKLLASEPIELKANDIIHMRLDPPMDESYLTALWLLQLLQSQGIEVRNHPSGILAVNEKILAYQQDSTYPAWLGSNVEQLEKVVGQWMVDYGDDFILKPLNSFSGIGVKRWSYSKDWHNIVSDLKGKVIVQPFLKQVLTGEKRILFYREKMMAAILKKPQSGEFLTNIAQGASYQACEVTDLELKRCQLLCSDLKALHVDLIAFDVLDQVITEVNITCPGLLVELSAAHARNIAIELLD